MNLYKMLQSSKPCHALLTSLLILTGEWKIKKSWNVNLPRIRHNPLQETPESLTPMPDLNSDVKKFGEENSLAFRFQHILKITQHAPYEKVMQGWFENYLNLKNFTLMESVSIKYFAP